MIAFLSQHRTVIVSIGVTMVIINIALNALVPADFAADQWPWMLAVFPMAAVGAVLAFRVSSSSVGWLLFGIAVAGSFGTWQGLNTLGGWSAALGAAGSTYAIAHLPLLVLLFPTGQPVSRRWKPVAWLSVAAALLGGLVALMTGGWGGTTEQVVYESPAFEAMGGFAAVGSSLFFPLYSLSFLLALGSVGVRYRTGEQEVRQQVKWLLVSALLVIGTLASLIVSRDVTAVAEGWQAYMLAAAMGSFPLP